jgi:hypothetical protein
MFFLEDAAAGIQTRYPKLSLLSNISAQQLLHLVYAIAEQKKQL